MKLRTSMTLGLATALLLVSALPVAAAASSCSRGTNSLQVALTCTMSGTCNNGSVCILTVSCSATYLGVMTGSCGGSPMICLVSACQGSAPLVVPTGAPWTSVCSVSGVSLNGAFLSCSVG